jgi:hypothetical protein
LKKLNTLIVVIYRENKEQFEEYLETNERTKKYKEFYRMYCKEEYKRKFCLKKMNLGKTLLNLNEGKKISKKLNKEYGIKNDIFTQKKLLKNDDLNLTKAIFIVQNKKIISQYCSDVSYER